MRPWAGGLLLLLLAGCAGTGTGTLPAVMPPLNPVIVVAGDRGAVAARLADQVAKCWFGTGDPSFRTLLLAPELNSYSGRPRVLLVEKAQPEGLPKLVVEVVSKGKAVEVSVFGPLLTTPLGSRIARDVERWARSGPGCA